MKKKYIIIIIGSIIVVSIVAITAIILSLTKNRNKVTISFDTNGGHKKSAIVIDKGTMSNLPEAKRNGYVFIGWYTEDGNIFDSQTIVTSDTKLVAKWQKEEDCPAILGGYSKTVKFNTMGGNTINNISICVTCAPVTIDLPTPTRTGYTFVGWYADAQFTTKVESDTNNVTNAVWTQAGCYNRETTIYAKWQKN